MVIREIGTLIEIEWSAIEVVGRRTPAGRYKIEHSILHEPFVIVNVARSDDDYEMRPQRYNKPRPSLEEVRTVHWAHLRHPYFVSVTSAFTE